MSIADNEFSDLVKYDGACPVCHGDPRRCRYDKQCPGFEADQWLKSQEANRAICAERGRHEWYLLTKDVMRCRQCGSIEDVAR